MTKKYHPAVLGAAAISITTLVVLIILEIVLQFMPVRSYMPLQPVTKEDPYLRYKPNIEQFYSAGWDFQVQNRSKTNAQGYIADFDFETKDTKNDKPLIAVIGDSYIEARMVPFVETVQARLGAALKNTHRVYGVGIGGSPLSQYLAFAEMMHRDYDPDFVIINIVSNDFDESLPEYKNKPRFHYFAKDEGGARRWGLIGEYHPSWFKSLISHSALVRYVYFHLDFANIFNRLQFMVRGGDGGAYTDNTNASVDEQRLYDSKQAVNLFLRELQQKTGVPSDHILLVLDGLRSDIYAGSRDRRDTYYGQMRAYLLDQARLRRIKVLDMQPYFWADYQANNKRFDFERDAHWNGYAHGLVARELLSNHQFKEYLRGAL